jgi:hypothetical protein
MAEMNSHAFETAVAAGMKLHASKRLNTMTNDDDLTSARECAAWANKALFLDLTEHQELLLADIIGKTLVADRARHQAVVAENATCKGCLHVAADWFGPGGDYDAEAHVRLLRSEGHASALYTADLVEKLYVALTTSGTGTDGTNHGAKRDLHPEYVTSEDHE